MIIQAATVFPNEDATRRAWAGLARFQDIAFVEEQIYRLHNLTKNDRANARKQARQIRYTLIQAKEYFDAGMEVTLATKPNLLYYCVMSLALAEILYKQSGDSSFDRARAEHKHHGLELRVDDSSGNAQFSAALSALRAVPLIGARGRRFGTFELWHRSCREMPLCGNITIHHRQHGGSSTRFGSVLSAGDVRLPLVPAVGLTLLDCFRALPGMIDFLSDYHVRSDVVRGRVSVGELRQSCQRNNYAYHTPWRSANGVFFF